MRALLISVGMLWALSSQAKVFFYHLEGFPKSAPGCHETAAEVGKKVSAVIKMPVNSRCISEGKDGYTIDASYEAETAFPLATTSNANLAVQPSGQYEQREECETELPGLVTIFQNETGLEALFNYCERVSNSEKLAWMAHIDAFGEAKRWPNLGGYFLFSSPLKYTSASYYDELTQALTKDGVTVTHVRSHPLGGMSSVTVHYYYEKRFLFNVREFSQSRDEKECFAELPVAKEVLSRFTNPPLLTYCGRTFTGNKELTSVFKGEPDVTASQSPESFKSFNECVAKRDALIAYYQNQLKRKVEGGICTGAKEEYHVTLFERQGE